MDNLNVDSRVYRPSFGMIKIPEYNKMSKPMQAIADGIKAELQKIDPNDAFQRTYEMIADAHGFDIYLRENIGKKFGIRVDMVTHRKSRAYEKKGKDIFNARTCVGFSIFENAKSFKTRYLKQNLDKELEARRTYKWLGCASLGVIAFFSSLFCLGSQYSVSGCSRQKANPSINPKELIQDTTKTVGDSAKKAIPSIYDAKKALKMVK